jgi:argininosuccinate lyase
MPLETLKTFSPLFEADVYDSISLEACDRGRKLTGGPAPETVARSITQAREI